MSLGETGLRRARQAPAAAPTSRVRLPSLLHPSLAYLLQMRVLKNTLEERPPRAASTSICVSCGAAMAPGGIIPGGMCPAIMGPIGPITTGTGMPAIPCMPCTRERRTGEGSRRKAPAALHGASRGRPALGRPPGPARR